MPGTAGPTVAPGGATIFQSKDAQGAPLRPSKMLKNSNVIPGRPVRVGPGTHEHRPTP